VCVLNILVLDFARPTTSHDFSRAKQVTGWDDVIWAGFGGDERQRRGENEGDDLATEEFSAVPPVEACGEVNGNLVVRL